MTLNNAECGSRALTVAVLVMIELVSSQQLFGQRPNEITFIEQVDRNEMIYTVSHEQIKHSPVWILHTLRGFGVAGAADLIFSFLRQH